MLYPVLTPLRNIIPRVGGGFGTQANWKAVTKINSAKISAAVSEGHRNAALTSVTADYNAVYKGIGYEHFVTAEAEYAAQGYIDLLARAQLEALQALMIGEDFLILGGNSTATGNAIGQTNTPVGTLQTISVTGMTAQSTVCYAMGLTIDGIDRATLGTTAPAVSAAQIARTNADNSSDTINPGHGAISAESAAVVVDATHTQVLWKVQPKIGEFGWAWFTGTTGAGNCTLAAVTTVPQFLQVANAAGTQLANATGLSSDYSQNPLAFDGILTQVVKSGSGGYYVTLGTNGTGSTLTPDTFGGIVEIDDMLQDRYNNFRLSPDTLWINAQQARDITKKVIASGGTGVIRINADAGGGGTQADIEGGAMVSSYLNKFMGVSLKIKIHPYMPAGTILATSTTLPYPANGVPNVIQIKTRKEYHSYEWPQTTRQRQYGVYADEVLQIYAPFALAVISSILPG